jgi:hypothetical protein
MLPSVLAEPLYNSLYLQCEQVITVNFRFHIHCLPPLQE